MRRKWKTPPHRTLSANEAQPFFDLNRLPQPKRPEPPPAPVATIDLAADIKRYTLLGITIGDREAVALLTSGAEPITLKERDQLAGFVLTHIQPREVIFAKDGVVTALSLP